MRVNAQKTCTNCTQETQMFGKDTNGMFAGLRRKCVTASWHPASHEDSSIRRPTFVWNFTVGCRSRTEQIWWLREGLSLHTVVIIIILISHPRVSQKSSWFISSGYMELCLNCKTRLFISIVAQSAASHTSKHQGKPCLLSISLLGSLRVSHKTLDQWLYVPSEGPSKNS